MIIKFIRIIALILFLLILIVIVNTLNNFRIIDYRHLNKGLKEKISRSSQVLDTIKQTTAPHENFSASKNQFFYRFDDHLSDAQYHEIQKNSFQTPVSQGIKLTFTDPDKLLVKPSGNQYTIQSGILSYKHSLKNVLTNIQPLDIFRDAVGEIELKIKVAHSDEIQICWSALPDVEINDHGKIEQIKIHTIPDAQFHIYRVPDLVMASWLYGRDRMVRKLFLTPINPETEDEIQIEYIYFKPKDEKYVQKPADHTYEKLNAEMRKGIYLHSGYELKYQVKIPDRQQIYFKCGTAALKNSLVDVEVIIARQGNVKTILSNRIEQNKKWQDFKINVSDFAGMDVSVIFRLVSEIPNIVFFSSPILYEPVTQKQNIILVIEDALRADRLSCYGYQRLTTPFKDKWRHEGILFQNVFSQSSFTRSSCASLLTSLYPSATGVWNNADRLSDNYETLAEILYHQGFSTALFSQNPNNGPFSGLHQGFETIIDNETIGKRAPGIYTSDALKTWLLDHADQNTFLFLHILDPHYPFDPPEEVSAPYRHKTYLFGKKGIPHDDVYDPSWLKQVTFESRNFLYDEEIRFNDLYFPQLIQILKEQEIYNDTLCVFTSDHGEHLGEHYLWDHRPPNYRRVLHVPLIMVYPKYFPAGIVVHQPLQLLDTLPTILDVAGILSNPQLFQGDSLLPFITGKNSWTHLNERICISDEIRYSTPRDLFINGGIFFKQYHIMSSDRHLDLMSYQTKERFEFLFNLFFRTQVFDNAKDPDETSSLINFIPDYIFAYNIRKLQKEQRQINIAIHDQIANNLKESIIYDNKTIEQLKSLGYIR